MSLADRTPPTPDDYRAYKQRFNNWGRWGPDDNLGTLNHITPERRKAAAALVREGITVSCANPLATAAVRTPNRNPQPAAGLRHRRSQRARCLLFAGG